jgi:serine/threonine protein kinase
VIDPDTKQKYAIKQISILQSGKGILKEIEILLNKNLEHINIVRYFTFFPDKGLINIIIEFCEEGNLEKYIKEKYNGKPPPEEVFF